MNNVNNIFNVNEDKRIFRFDLLEFLNFDVVTNDHDSVLLIESFYFSIKQCKNVDLKCQSVLYVIIFINSDNRYGKERKKYFKPTIYSLFSLMIKFKQGNR